MDYKVRRMLMSEHTEDSWSDLFDQDPSEQQNFCVIYTPSGRVVDTLLTLEGAQSAAAYYQDVDDQDAFEYAMDMVSDDY